MDVCPAHKYLDQGIEALTVAVHELRDAEKATSLLVARIAGHLGLNGGDEPAVGTYSHRRETDESEAERRHSRTVDAIITAIKEHRGLPMPPRWFIIAGVAAFVLSGMAILYMMLTGLNHEAISDLSKIHNAVPK